MLRRPIASALLLCYLAACTSWHVEKGVNPQQLISTEHPSAVRVTRADSSQMVLDAPQIAPGDTLVGLHNGASVRVAVPDVTQVATRRFSPVKTLGVVVGLGAVVVGIAVIECLKGNSSGTGACSSN
jgi:hypothetical protein